MFSHVGFVTPRNETETITPQESYLWRGKVAVVLEDGSRDLLETHEVTYRQLLATSALGLVDGDVTRPIIQPSIPQGAGGTLLELVEYASHLAPTVYSEIDKFFGYAEHTITVVAAAAPRIDRVANEIVDEGVRIAAVATSIAKLRGRYAKK
jgi:hypothetical protein